MNDNLNMSIRKFLKEVGVTSQRAIENAWNQADIPEGSTVEAKIVLTIKTSMLCILSMAKFVLKLTFSI